MTIEVVPSTRIDQLVTGLDGRTLHRTDHRGVAWFGGRQQAQTGGVAVIRKQTAAIVSPFWLPDTLAYRSESVGEIRISCAVGALYVSENCAIAEVEAHLAANDRQPGISHVYVHVRGTARIPLALSYDVTVLAPAESVVAP